MKKKIGTYIVSLIIIVLTLGYDQWTKHIVEQSIQLNERIEVIKKTSFILHMFKIQGQALVYSKALV